MNILLADDDKNFTKTLAGVLTLRGHSVCEAPDGLEALDKFRKGSFQLVLVDLKMPRMDGLELLKRIKQIEPKTAVVILTGYGTIRSAVDAIKDGAYDYLTKPVKFQELEAIISQTTNGRDLAKDLDGFRGLSVSLILSLPFWLILGIVFAMKYLLK